MPFEGAALVVFFGLVSRLWLLWRIVGNVKGVGLAFCVGCIAASTLQRERKGSAVRTLEMGAADEGVWRRKWSAMGDGA